MILLESKHICKNFGPKPALRDINVTIECGKIIGLLGPNGSGKTTFFEIDKRFAHTKFRRTFYWRGTSRRYY